MCRKKRRAEDEDTYVSEHLTGGHAGLAGTGGRQIGKGQRCCQRIKVGSCPDKTGNWGELLSPAPRTRRLRLTRPCLPATESRPGGKGGNC